MQNGYKSNSPPYKKITILFILLVIPIVIYFSLLDTRNLQYLPYYGPKEVKLVTIDGKQKEDTLYHTIPAFGFIDQHDKQVTDKDFENRIYVADFFFTTCPSICPKMATQMTRVQESFKDIDGFAILSHTVNPEHDSVSVLATYAGKINAIDGKWHLVTGDKKAIYDIARKGYLVTTSEGDGGPDDFIHSPMFILVDKEKRIRGYYDGTIINEVDNLIRDIKTLFAQYGIESEQKLNFTP